MIRRFLCFCFVLILLLVLDDFSGSVKADEVSDLVVGEMPASGDGILRAFTPPDKKESELAASRVFGILYGVVLFVVILFILMALFYSRKTGLPKPTVLRRGKKDVPSNQREKEPEEHARYVIDED